MDAGAYAVAVMLPVIVAEVGYSPRRAMLAATGGYLTSFDGLGSGVWGLGERWSALRSEAGRIRALSQ
jgi:hypothetical protein